MQSPFPDLEGTSSPDHHTDGVNSKRIPLRHPPISEETMEMPDDVLVRCPLVDFNLRAVARHCQACPHFHGAADRFPGSDKPPDKRYLVLCGEPVPVKRELFKVVD